MGPAHQVAMARLPRLAEPVIGIRISRILPAVLAALECRLVAWIARPDIVHAHYLHDEAAACSEYEARIRSRVRALNIAHALRWLPRQTHEQMPGVYALADRVISYPRSDIFPATLLEAAASAPRAGTRTLTLRREP